MTIYRQSNTETLQTPGNAVEAGRQIGQVEYLSKPVSPYFFFSLEDKSEVVHSIILYFYGTILSLFLCCNNRLKIRVKSKIKFNYIGMLKISIALRRLDGVPIKIYLGILDVIFFAFNCH